MAFLLKRLFENEVIIQITKDKIVLKSYEKVVEFEPIIFISSESKKKRILGFELKPFFNYKGDQILFLKSDPKKRKILGFGSDFIPQESYIKIEPMKPGDLPVDGLSKSDCLATIIQYYCRDINKCTFIRPKLIVYGYELLAETLKYSDQKDIYEFFESMGAIEVVLEK
jgi:hypothetical protein